jgi:Major Facilitator Superfamily
MMVVLVLLAISAFINYVDRGNLSIAAPLLKGELGIFPSKHGLLLSAFFWTYACSQLFSGWLVDRLNVNWVFASGFILWSAATAITGIAHTFVALFALQLLLGMGESVVYPSYSKIIASNFSEEPPTFGPSLRRWLDRFSELRRQSRRHCGSLAYRIRAGAHRAFLLGLRDPDWRSAIGRGILVFSGRARRAGSVGRETARRRGSCMSIDSYASICPQ